MKKLATLLIILIAFKGYSQELTGKQLLEKAIQYHDSNGTWSTFKGTLFVTMETPKSPKRESEITIDLQNQFFSVKAKSGKNKTEYLVEKDNIQILFNGKKIHQMKF
jgi:hypothetical protein